MFSWRKFHWFHLYKIRRFNYLDFCLYIILNKSSAYIFLQSVYYVIACQNILHNIRRATITLRYENIRFAKISNIYGFPSHRNWKIYLHIKDELFENPFIFREVYKSFSPPSRDRFETRLSNRWQKSRHENSALWKSLIFLLPSSFRFGKLYNFHHLETVGDEHEQLNEVK